MGTDIRFKKDCLICYKHNAPHQEIQGRTTHIQRCMLCGATWDIDYNEQANKKGEVKKE